MLERVRKSPDCGDGREKRRGGFVAFVIESTGITVSGEWRMLEMEILRRCFGVCSGAIV